MFSSYILGYIEEVSLLFWEQIQMDELKSLVNEAVNQLRAKGWHPTNDKLIAAVTKVNNLMDKHLRKEHERIENSDSI